MSSGGVVIAIVDDDPAVCDSTRLLLETYGFTVCTYQSGADFLLSKLTFACLIVDYHMPGMNGLEFVSELRQRGNSTPTMIMITATTDATVERRAAELGIQQVLKKPLSSQVLVSSIRNQLERAAHAGPRPAAGGGHR
jgi:FixJ family two-component response regulator